ncbi:hypothetical protein AB0N17_43700 [Streptomyces sp. NPDC051133]|uniref:hypothetical protein n=1 Tax=Streptomyces sp. NPDC051133 TaxID=3155521 RepID=UPI003425ECD1
MARINQETRTRNEHDVRAAMERLLDGDVPPGHTPGLKALAQMAGVPRSSFYSVKNRDGTRRRGPYQHLAEEFDRRLHRTRTEPAAKGRQTERLKVFVDALSRRLAQCEAELAELREFKQVALSRIITQHLEIQRLREHITRPQSALTASDGTGRPSLTQ